MEYDTKDEQNEDEPAADDVKDEVENTKDANDEENA